MDMFQASFDPCGILAGLFLSVWTQLEVLVSYTVLENSKNDDVINLGGW